MEREQRTIEGEELRIADDESGKIEGYAAVFNRKSVPLGFMGFREQIAPGAFSETIKTADVRALFNHDPSMVLGRTTNGTLTLEEDKKGLRVSIDPPNTTWANDVRELIKRGDVSQMSFGFEMVADEWDESGKTPLRTLRQVNLFDVSPVTFPAYPQTSVKARTMLAEVGLDWDAVIGAMTKRDQGLPVSEAEYKLIEDTIETLRGYLPEPVLPVEVAPVWQRELERFLELADRN